MKTMQGTLILLLASLCVACGGGGGSDSGGSSGGGSGGSGGGGGGGGNTGSTGPDIDQFFTDMQTWDQFAPKSRDEANEGFEVVDDSEPPVVENVVDANNILKECTTEKVDFFETPEEYVMFAPPTNVLYPGALVVGESLRDGATPGDILPINVAQRTEVDVTIAACNFAGNTRRVPPTLSAVNAAVGDIIFEAQQAGVDCINPSGSLRVDTFRNEEQRALQAGISGRYFGFSASASGSFQRNTTENSVAAVFRESLYTVDISAPQSPSGWFTDEFTPELLQDQIDQGTMSETNIPAYVARVTYGRIMTATMTSTFSESDMRAAMDFKYANPTASVSGDAATRSQTIREASRFTLSYLGGSADATSAMLRSQDWTQYFGVPVEADDAVPISFEIRSTKDNVPAVVQELTSYDRTTCLDKVAADETFRFEPEQEFSAGFSDNGQTVAIGDVDGVNGDDIVWAATPLNARGELAVALSNGDGTYQPLIKHEIPLLNGVAGKFSLHVMNVESEDGDTTEEIVLNILPPTGDNLVAVTFFDNGTFVQAAPQVLRTSNGWDTYAAFPAQMDGLNGTDLMFNNTPIGGGSTNQTYIAKAVDTTQPGFNPELDPLFEMTGPFPVSDTGFPNYEYIHVADFNNDGRDDIVWHNIDDNVNEYYSAFGTENGLEQKGKHRLSTSNWRVYTALAGDMNADGNADLVMPRIRATRDVFGIYYGTGSGVGLGRTGTTIDGLRFLNHDEPSIESMFGAGTGDGSLAEDPYPEVRLGDVDGDGTLDFLINDRGFRDNLSNNIGVGLGLDGGPEFTFNRVSQSLPPAIDWSGYEWLIGDVNGDGLDDVLWIESEATSSVYVGVAVDQ